jgi:hypothetical protein
MKPGGLGSVSCFPDLIVRCLGGAIAEPNKLVRRDDFLRVQAPLLWLGLRFPFGEVRFRARSGRSGDGV